MNKGSKVAGSVEGERISRVGYEPCFKVDLAAGMKQVDPHRVVRKSAARLLRRTAIKMTLFGALDEQATAIFDLEAIQSILLGNWGATDLVGKTLLL